MINNSSSENSGNHKQNGNSSINTLSQERATKSNAIEIPQISLPKGGGASKGIDETLKVSASNGTSSLNSKSDMYFLSVSLIKKMDFKPNEFLNNLKNKNITYGNIN